MKLMPLAAILCLSLCGAAGAHAQTNLLANPGFETAGQGGFATGWGAGSFGKVGTTLFVDTAGAHSGQRCLRMVGTPNTWTTCAADPVTVKPQATCWVTWWFKGKQPASSRTYLFLQTNLAQRVFPHTDRHGDFDWVLNIASYRTKPGETSLSPVLTMQTSQNEIGTSWWDEVGVWEKLPPDLEAVYRRDHPWDDVATPTAQRFARADSCVVWGDRAEARVYPQTPVPGGAPLAKAVALTAPGRGHDLYQLVVSPTREMEPVSLRFSLPAGPGAMPAESLSYRVVRCVPVREVRDTSFPLGPTPDPLVEPVQPEPARATRRRVGRAGGASAIFWIEWAPPAGGKAGVYAAEVQVLSGGQRVATVPLRLRRWGFDLPEVPHYRSMVMIGVGDILRLYPGLSVEQAYELAWSALSANRLSGFNVVAFPQVSLKVGKLAPDWTRFDQILAAAKRYRATALTLGPMFGGGDSAGWRPWKLLGFTPLADAGFDPLYVDLNRQMAARLRAAGLLDRSYVYPYDEPEPDYMDRVARLCDLVHQGDPELKCLMTVTPTIAQPLWGKVKAWIVPWTEAHSGVVAERAAAGDEVWVYNMIAASRTRCWSTASSPGAPSGRTRGAACCGTARGGTRSTPGRTQRRRPCPWAGNTSSSTATRRARRPSSTRTRRAKARWCPRCACR